MNKPCSSCGQDLPLEMFYPSKSGKYGRHSRCKSCANKATVACRAKNSRFKEKSRAYKDLNKSRGPSFIVTCKVCPACGETKGGVDFYQDKGRPDWLSCKCKDCESKRSNKYRANNRHVVNRAYRMLYSKSTTFKVSKLLRSRIYDAVGRSGKCASTSKLLGCSIEDFKAHLESRFQEGMSWENYSYNGWHIDHIRPCSSFDLSDPAQQRVCFHYTNLQPMWARENQRKSDKWQDQDLNES